MRRSSTPTTRACSSTSGSRSTGSATRTRHSRRGDRPGAVRPPARGDGGFVERHARPGGPDRKDRPARRPVPDPVRGRRLLLARPCRRRARPDDAARRRAAPVRGRPRDSARRPGRHAVADTSASAPASRASSRTTAGSRCCGCCRSGWGRPPRAPCTSCCPDDSRTRSR